MSSNAYQLLALAARALFLFWGALIVLRAAFNLLAQHRARKRLLRLLPDAGMVGEMRDVESNQAYPLPREGVLGSGRGCDIRLKGLRRRQVNFAYVDGKGILLTPCHRRTDTQLDGEPLRRSAYALHGAILQVGGYTLRIRLFAGLNVPHPAQYQEHWQPAYDDELYAPDETQMENPYAAYMPWAQAVWPREEGEDAPVFNYAPAPQPMPQPPQHGYAPPPQQAYMQPSQEEEYPAPLPAPDSGEPFLPEQEQAPAPFDAPRRHRRSDRRREV